MLRQKRLSELNLYSRNSRTEEQVTKASARKAILDRNLNLSTDCDQQMDKVSTLEQLLLRGSTYIFLLVGERDQKDELQRVLNDSFEEFSEGPLAIRAARATRRGRRDVLHQVWQKPWSDQIRHRMLNDHDPFLMLFMKDFSDFDPSVDGWRIVWLGDARNPRNSIPRLLNAFTMETERGTDLFKWLDSKASPVNGQSEYGCISSPQAPHTTKREGKPGRPSMMLPEYGVRDTIERMISNEDVPFMLRGWKTEFAERLRRKNGSLREFEVKSIADCLRKEGIFDEIESRMNKRRDS